MDGGRGGVVGGGRAVVRVLGAGARGLLGLIVLVVALVGGAVLHLGTAPARRIVATQLPVLLEGALPGSLVVHQLGALAVDGVSRVDIDLLHPDGARVATLRGVSVRLDTWSALRSLAGAGPLDVPLREVSIDAVDVDVSSREGRFRVLEVFVDPDAPETPADPTARGLDLRLERLAIAHVWAHGTIDAGGPVVDVDVDRLLVRIASTPEAITVGLEHAELVTRQAPRTADLRVRISAAFTMPAAPAPGQSAMLALVAIGGTVGGTPASALAMLAGDTVHGMVSLPALTSGQLRDLAPEAPALGATAAIAAMVDGTLPRLSGHMVVLAATSRVDLDAEVMLEPVLTAAVELRGRSLDAALLGGPTSALSLTADAVVRVPEGGAPSGEVHVATERGTLGELVIPAVVASGTFRGERASGKADIHEPGVLTHLTFEVTPGPAGLRVDATLDAPRVELARLHARGVDARGTLTVAGRGRVDLETAPGTEYLDATVRLTGRGLSSPLVPDASVGHLELDVRAAGALRNPEVHASLLAAQVGVAGQRIDTATIQLTGPALHARVTAAITGADLPQIRARTLLHLEPAVLLEGTSIEASRGITTAQVRVDRVELGSGAPALRNVMVDGLGERITLSVLPTPRGGTRVVARAPHIALPALTQLTAVSTGIARGRIGLEADVELGSGRIDGSVLLTLDDLDARARGVPVHGLQSRVYATFERRRVAFDLAVDAGALGRIEASSRRPLELSGPPSEPRSWLQATGQLAVDVDLDLAAAARFVPAETLPVADVSGRLVLVGQVDRDAPGRPPTARIAARTDHLAVVGKPSPPATAARGTTPRKGDPTPVPAWTLRGIDLALNASAEADPRRVSVTVAASDVSGALVTARLDSELAYERLLGGEPIDRRWLEEQPFVLQATVPSRPIASLPDTLGIPDAGGRVVGDLRVEGTMRKPVARLDVALVQLSMGRTRLEQPFSTKLVARYDGATAVAHLAVDRETTRLLRATASGEVAMAALLHPTRGQPLPWTASAEVELGPLPLEILQVLLPTRIEGVAHGRVTIDALHRDASLEADLHVDGLVLGGIPHRTAALKVTARDGKLDGSLRLVQPNGSLQADVDVGIAWGAALTPELRAGRFDVGLRADNFRIRAVEPFVTSIFHQLDGRLDGAVRISEAAIEDALKPGAVQAQLALSRGRIEAAAGGGPLEDVRARVRLDDKGVLRLEDVFARGQTGEVRAAGLVTFGGGTFRTAKLDVVVPARRPMPLLVEGEHLGDISGSIRAQAGWADGGRELRVGVDIPRLAVALPDRMPDGVQKLGDLQRARIGTIRNGRFVPLPLDAPDPPASRGAATFRTRVDVRLRDASITMADLLRTRLSGNPSLVLQGGETRMAGALTVQGGKVDIKGRLFEIERGTITFGADPANPDVILTARWEAPDGTMVYADFAGPVQTGKVTLRSNPVRSREEIIALVVFGRVEGLQPGGDQADTSTQAIGAAGGFATQGLNAALDDLTSLEIRTRVDTSSSTNPRPELELQISQEVALRIAYLLGEIAPGQAADKTFATVDWNFRPEWSVETTVGDKASSTVDLIWEHLY